MINIRNNGEYETPNIGSVPTNKHSTISNSNDYTYSDIHVESNNTRHQLSPSHRASQYEVPQSIHNTSTPSLPPPIYSTLEEQTSPPPSNDYSLLNEAYSTTTPAQTKEEEPVTKRLSYTYATVNKPKDRYNKLQHQ